MSDDDQVTAEYDSEETDSKKGYGHWMEEFSYAEKGVKKWHKNSDKVVRRFLDDRAGDEKDWGFGLSRLNLFHSNIVTLQAMLYGRVPKVEVDRKFADANDDVARVAAEMLTRMLNQDIQDAGEDQVSVLRQVLQDRLIPGMGTARVAYNFESDGTQVTEEWVDIIYVHWRDILWSPARTYNEITWKAFRAYMDKDAVTARFGEKIANQLPFSSRGAVKTDKGNEGLGTASPQVEVWEIWDKATRKVYWMVKGFDKLLDEKEDPLQLEQFFPDPPPLAANITTTKFMPKSDYELAQDLYEEIDKLQTRISYLTDACKVVGVYDKANDGVKRIFTEGVENDLIPVDNWAAFGEKGGLKGVIDWVPIVEIVNTIDVLTQKQGEKIQQLYQITGMSDIMRGASQPYEAAATSKAKVQFASIRVQALQDEFARFASDLQSLKMEIIQKHFQPYCIIQQSNIEATPDAQYAPQAVEFLKDRSKARWRMQIRPESLAMADYAQLKADRMEYINGLAMFMQSAAPLVQLDKKIVPTLLKLLQWGLAGFKGSNEIEGVMDQAIDQYTKMAQQPEQPKPDPAMIKAQTDMQIAQQEMKNDKELHMMEMQQDREKHQQEMMQRQQEFELKMKEMMMQFELKSKELMLTMQAKTKEQEAQFAFNTAQRQTEANINREEREHTAATNKEEREHEAAVSMVSDREKAKRDSGGSKDK